MKPSNLSRRDFVGTAVGTTLAAGLATTPFMARAAGANARLRIGVIGVGNRGFNTLVKKLVELRELGRNIDLVAVSDVYTVHRDRFIDYIKDKTGITPSPHLDYRELLQLKDLDAVVIATPDHWHAKQTMDALAAGKHVYCEKPVTHTIEESKQIIEAWKSSGLVMQVGVQSSSCPVWDMAKEMIDDGKLGKIVQFQTESARNSKMGMSRHNVITKEMTPKTVDFRRFLGVDEGFHEEVPFDRAIFGQWRCYWPFGFGMYSDLFVHRITGMLKATGLRMPGRVVGGGGIFLEYDDRQVTDVASILADFHEGVQGVISSTMVAEEEKLDHIVRGHHGLLKFSKQCYNNGNNASFEFIPERPQVTLNGKAKPETFEVSMPLDMVLTHIDNWLDAIDSGTPESVNNDPVLGAAAMMIVNLAVRSYREGKVFQIDPQGKIGTGDTSWALQWEKMSKEKAKPRHVPGWRAGETGSVLHPPAYQSLAGPWIDGKPPTR